jgi:hypothetical protein
MMPGKKSLGGRPRHGDEPKTSPLSLRIEPRLREKLEESRSRRGVSLTREVEQRLWQTFGGSEHERHPELWAEIRKAAEARGWTVEEEVEARLERQHFGTEAQIGERTWAIAMMFASTISIIEHRTGKSWFDDVLTWRAAESAVELLMRQNAPHPLWTEGEQGAHEEALSEAYSEQQRAIRLVGELLDMLKLKTSIFRWRELLQADPTRDALEIVPEQDWEDFVSILFGIRSSFNRREAALRKADATPYPELDLYQKARAIGWTEAVKVLRMQDVELSAPISALLSRESIFTDEVGRKQIGSD